MRRFVYERMVEELSKKTKEELIQEIMALEEIECDDRCFANECRAGDTCYNINALFSGLKDLKTLKDSKDSKVDLYEKVAKVCDLAERAERSWSYVKHELQEINDSSRFYKVLKDFRDRVNSGSDDI